MTIPYDPGRYVLMGKLAVPEPDLLKWGRWFGTANRHVAVTQVGGIRISTVFLGLDHNFSRFFGEPGEHLPILFETMVFRGGEGGDGERYETWEQAEAGHKKWVARVRAEIKEKVND